jgi:hypothetical protein
MRAKFVDGRLVTDTILALGPTVPWWGTNWLVDVAPSPDGYGVVLLADGSDQVYKLYTVTTPDAAAMTAMAAVRCACMQAVVKGGCQARRVASKTSNHLAKKRR